MDVRTACLGLLTFGEATGYEIKKAFEDGAFRSFIDASFGSIYPALNKLTEDGHVTCKAMVQDGRPDKKIYSITEAGRSFFKDALQETPQEDKFRSEFLFWMTFSDLMSASRVSGLIDNQVAQYQTKVEELRQLSRTELQDGEQFVVGFGEAIFAASIEYLKTHRHLVEDQFVTERPVRGAAIAAAE